MVQISEKKHFEKSPFVFPKRFTGSGLPPVLELQTVNSFTEIWRDKGSGASMDGAFYRPSVPAGFHLLGDYGQGNYSNPIGSVLVIKVISDDPDQPALTAPDSWTRVWKDTGSGADKDGSFWAPVPKFGYVAVGHVVMEGHDTPPDLPSFRCLRYDLATDIDLGGLIWSDQGSGANEDVSIYRVDRVGVFVAWGSYDQPTIKASVPSALM